MVINIDFVWRAYIFGFGSLRFGFWQAGFVDVERFCHRECE